MKLALCLALLGVQAFAAETIPGGPSVIPHVVDGDGWKTIFTVVNLDSSAASFTLRSMPTMGLLWRSPPLRELRRPSRPHWPRAAR